MTKRSFRSNGDDDTYDLLVDNRIVTYDVLAEEFTDVLRHYRVRTGEVYVENETGNLTGLGR